MASEYNSLHALALDAISSGVIPGAVIAAGRLGQAPLIQAFGQRQVEPQPAPAAVDTVYDLASLTKALVTSVLFMRAVADGRLNPDEPLGQHLVAMGAGSEHFPDVTLR